MKLLEEHPENTKLQVIWEKFVTAHCQDDVAMVTERDTKTPPVQVNLLAHFLLHRNAFMDE